ncbi:MAG: bifunctional [glutamate--ammonia ligase]-adenylyl-L-tyrosine phosphorylase/[glutamate--ammonia-ligase] adenylyltransferase [Gammaproteobacteria bacterium]
MRTSLNSSETWSKELLGPIRGALADLRTHCPTLVAALAAADVMPDLERVLALSEFVQRTLRRRATWLAHAARDGRMARPDRPRIDDVLDQIDDTSVALRTARDRELVLICWHDLLGQRSTRETLAALSELADRLIAAACTVCVAQMAAERQHDIEPPIILGMGKLGGGELNFSSDVDLVFLHPNTDEDRSVLYAKLARRIIGLLDERTEEGFVYRVDVRLRPFGSTGALSLSCGAFETYLQSHARDWERYAYIKARALTGTHANIATIEQSLRGYVYRRYLDFGVLESLRKTKGLIETDVRRKDADHDVKRGSGGIREIEFVVQALQLLRGGQQRELQLPPLLPALAQLSRLGWVDDASAAQLRDAYLFLRHIENRLQQWSDQQTHSLPETAVGRTRLAIAMGMPDWPALAQALDQHRAAVASHFRALLGTDGALEGDAGERDLWSVAEHRDELLERLGDRALTDKVVALRTSRFVGRLGRLGRERLDKLMPELLSDILRTDAPAQVFERLALVLEGVGRRSAYFALLNENPAARERLVTLCAQSARIARDVAEKPLLLDSLIDPHVAQLPSRSAHSAQLRAALHGIARDDLELLIDSLSQFKSSAVFEVAVADLSSQLPVMQVSDQLTWVAQSIVGEVLAVARRDARERYGNLADTSSAMSVIAYGKLGGIELGYGSDLDLVFIYEASEPDAPTDGERALPASMYYARIVQRFVHIASATTRTGSLYAVDMRLRPSGNSGALCSRIEAFARYQTERAWTWEHQALLRARPVAGDEGLGERFSALRQQILCTPRERSALSHDVTTMRARMQRSHASRRGQFHVKHDRGGLTDVEFLVQFFLLMHAPEERALVAFSDHMRQLDALVAAGCLAAGVGEDLQVIYLNYRTRLHRAALNETGNSADLTEFSAESERVRALWTETFG